MLTREQADAVADAVMASDKERQRERAQQREAERRTEWERRRWAIVALSLMAVGGAVGYFAHWRVSTGVIIGALPTFIARLAAQGRRGDEDR